ncbi:hypothetical protein HDA40_002074 [Hamadaea flava]|uniref:Uncharacterized protein n=1 Tax=Hamadaea flava TaxID=1742688 RepID=A0ABV8LJH8_9ACTN|nr:hypothetical protein [Hamadaea flava]MCP2323567.1 hypothetical protein [Hamadaea flava]
MPQAEVVEHHARIRRDRHRCWWKRVEVDPEDAVDCFEADGLVVAADGRVSGDGDRGEDPVAERGGAHVTAGVGGGRCGDEVEVGEGVAVAAAERANL